MSVNRGISRRQFITSSTLTGGGLLLACYLPFGRNLLAAAGSNFAPNAFLRVAPDGRVTVIINKSEMGQGVYTSLPMLVAEELCCDWKDVTFQASPVAPEYNRVGAPIMVTGGSSSIRTEWERLSLAGATAREMLIAAAAKEWQVARLNVAQKTVRSLARAVKSSALVHWPPKQPPCRCRRIQN